MMGDLISKADVCEILADMYPTDGEAVISYKEIDRAYTKVQDLPSVPAVPLDKLCEWLGEQGMLAPCYFDQKCDHCNLSPYWRRKKSECWRHVLTEWMEGLDGTD